MNEIKVSVIMSAYNSDSYIREAIESVLNQSLMEFELLITDDNSLDKTKEIIKEYTDKRVVLIENNEQKGLTANLNNMIKVAKGKYIARLDADDICDIRRLELQCDYLDHHLDYFAVCSYAEAFGSKKGIIKMPKSYKDISASLLFSNPLVHSSVMFRNEGVLYDSDYLKSQDYELWTRLIHDGKKIGIIKNPLVLFRYHESQISCVSKEEQLKFANAVRYRALKWLGVNCNNRVWENYQDYLCNGIVRDNFQLKYLLKLFNKMILVNKRTKEYDNISLKKAIKRQYILMFFSIKNNRKINYGDILYVFLKAFSPLLFKCMIAN